MIRPKNEILPEWLGSSGLRVASDIIGTDAEICDLQPLYIVDIEALIQHAVLDDAVSFLRGHGARLCE